MEEQEQRKMKDIVRICEAIGCRGRRQARGQRNGPNEVADLQRIWRKALRIARHMTWVVKLLAGAEGGAIMLHSHQALVLEGWSASDRRCF